jgi:hypothetical protein
MQIIHSRSQGPPWERTTPGSNASGNPFTISTESSRRAKEPQSPDAPRSPFPSVRTVRVNRACVWRWRALVADGGRWRTTVGGSGCELAVLRALGGRTSCAQAGALEQLACGRGGWLSRQVAGGGCRWPSWMLVFLLSRSRVGLRWFSRDENQPQKATVILARRRGCWRPTTAGRNIPRGTFLSISLRTCY